MTSVTIAASASPSAVAELARELARSLVHVRLVDGDQAAARAASRAVASVARDLGRIVAVVVEDRDAAALADELEAAADAR